MRWVDSTYLPPSVALTVPTPSQDMPGVERPPMWKIHGGSRIAPAATTRSSAPMRTRERRAPRRGAGGIEGNVALSGAVMAPPAARARGPGTG